ncbi:MAG: cytochrome c [Alphaproteobacteria bacterium]|nr:cytochrome c [Alphaproteobacteria bacterium]
MGRIGGLSATVAVGVFLLASPVKSHAEALLERGTYLMQGIVACGNCHTPQGPEGPVEGMELAGQFLIEMGDAFTAYAPNITPDPETGIGAWSDADIATAIREGRRPDGSIIGPPMPIELYRDISDRDVAAIIAYLRSVPAVRNEVPRSTYNIPLPPAYGPPAESVAEVPRDDMVAYGAYLAGPLGHCIECHSTPVDGRPDFEHHLGAGGFVLEGPWGLAVSRNITPHPEDGIGHWTDAEIKRAITEGIRADGDPLSPPMGFGYYRNLDESDLDAIVAYLRTLPPLPFPE